MNKYKVQFMYGKGDIPITYELDCSDKAIALRSALHREERCCRTLETVSSIEVEQMELPMTFKQAWKYMSDDKSRRTMHNGLIYKLSFGDCLMVKHNNGKNTSWIASLVFTNMVIGTNWTKGESEGI